MEKPYKKPRLIKKIIAVIVLGGLLIISYPIVLGETIIEKIYKSR